VQSAAVFGEESLEDRSGPALQALSMAGDHPVMGVGAGAFYTVFPRYAAPEHRGQYDHAHNDYAQIAAETGLLGFGLLAVVVLAAVFKAAQVLRQPLRSIDRGLALGIITAVVAVLSQAFVDFHFQIPANALTFMVILGLAWVLKTQSRPN
jgi:O-antigen ligase